MARKAPPEVEVKWKDGSFRAVGNLTLILVALLLTAYLAMPILEKFLG
jgi:hypothetical protein